MNTRIHESTRNWLDRLGPEPANDSPVGEFMGQMVQDAVASGAAPETLARQVVDAIRDGRFLVTTDAPLARAVTDNRRNEVDGNAPVLPPLM